MLTSRTMGETLTPNPNAGVESQPKPYILGEGVNYLTLRMEVYTNKWNEGRLRDANT